MPIIIFRCLCIQNKPVFFVLFSLQYKQRLLISWSWSIDFYMANTFEHNEQTEFLMRHIFDILNTYIGRPFAYNSETKVKRERKILCAYKLQPPCVFELFIYVCRLILLLLFLRVCFFILIVRKFHTRLIVIDSTVLFGISLSLYNDQRTTYIPTRL